MGEAKQIEAEQEGYGTEQDYFAPYRFSHEIDWPSLDEMEFDANNER